MALLLGLERGLNRAQHDRGFGLAFREIGERCCRCLRDNVARFSSLGRRCRLLLRLGDEAFDADALVVIVAVLAPVLRRRCGRRCGREPPGLLRPLLVIIGAIS